MRRHYGPELTKSSARSASGATRLNHRITFGSCPQRYVGPYAEADVISTLALFDDLYPVLDKEGTRDAYRLECDILPMVLEMRLRGIRIDLDAAERAGVLLRGKRDAALSELSEKLGNAIGMDEIHGKKWLIETFDRHNIKYGRTKKGNPSFTAGKSGWMAQHEHWLPRQIATANKYDKAGCDFVQKLLDYTIDGRIHAEINPHRSEDNGTKSFRFFPITIRRCNRCRRAIRSWAR